jgi:hypothetical protein
VALETRFGPTREGGIGAHGDEKPTRRGIDAFDVHVECRGDEGERRRRAITEEARIVAWLLGASDDATEGDCNESDARREGRGRHRLIVAGPFGFVEARVGAAALRGRDVAPHWKANVREKGHVDSQHTLIREGVIAGAIGATSVALWFLTLDIVAGHPFFTPSALGAVLTGDFSSAASTSVHLPWVIRYTVFHFVAFLAVGLILSFVAHRAEREPSILAVFLILFVVFELAFYGLTAILAETRLPGALAWYRVAGGNLVAALVMGSYMWRGHRALPAEFANALGARE